MTRWVTIVEEFNRDEDGVSVVEYGLLIALISIAAVAGASALGIQIGNLFTAASASI